MKYVKKYHPEEGYHKQGSRMIYHRPTSIIEDFNRSGGTNIFWHVRDNTNNIHGSISLLEENGHLEISNFYVSKPLRGNGVGKFLLKTMIDISRMRGYKNVYLTSRRKGGTETALHLFESFGFKEITDIDELNKIIRPEYQSPRTIAMVLIF